jgi:hypothetical protein
LDSTVRKALEEKQASLKELQAAEAERAKVAKELARERKLALQSAREKEKRRLKDEVKAHERALKASREASLQSRVDTIAETSTASQRLIATALSQTASSLLVLKEQQAEALRMSARQHESTEKFVGVLDNFGRSLDRVVDRIEQMSSNQVSIVSALSALSQQQAHMSNLLQSQGTSFTGALQLQNQAFSGALQIQAASYSESSKATQEDHAELMNTLFKEFITHLNSMGVSYREQQLDMADQFRGSLTDAQKKFLIASKQNLESVLHYVHE